MTDHADEVCTRYAKKYPALLSGKGKQLSPRKGKLEITLKAFNVRPDRTDSGRFSDTLNFREF